MLIIQTAIVNKPAGEEASLLGASWQRKQFLRHCKHECSSTNDRLNIGGGIFPWCDAWFNWTLLNNSSKSVTPSTGSPTNSWTKLKKKENTG